MVNKFFVFVLSILSVVILGGCVPKDNVRVKYITKNVPIYVVPTPPHIDKPVLAITTLTDNQKQHLGELVKASAISLEQLAEYACELKQIVNYYDQLSKEKQYIVQPNIYKLTINNIYKLTINMVTNCENN